MYILIEVEKTQEVWNWCDRLDNMWHWRENYVMSALRKTRSAAGVSLDGCDDKGMLAKREVLMQWSTGDMVFGTEDVNM